MHISKASRLAAAVFTTTLAAAGCSSASDERAVASESDALRVIGLPIRVLHPELRGLLASPVLDAQPMKGIYFFPGEGQGIGTGPKACNYTATPRIADDVHWNSQPGVRGSIVDRMVATHANVIVMSYWQDQPGSPMDLDATSVPGVLAAALGKPIVIMPAIESVDGASFAANFPGPNGTPSSLLVQRIATLILRFGSHMDQWAQMYDRTGTPRYAIHLLHVGSSSTSLGLFSDLLFANGFKAVADFVQTNFHVPIGFTLDLLPPEATNVDNAAITFHATPAMTGAYLEQTDAVLAIQRFNPAVWSISSTATCTTSCGVGAQCCGAIPDGCAPFDNNDAAHLSTLVAAEAHARDWVTTHVPVIADASSGFDGRLVWLGKARTGFYGDNKDYSSDAWRNSMSMLKAGGAVGATFNTWNGFTEGYAAVPTFEHGTTVTRWLTDYFTPDPRVCDHVQYVNGVATNHVWGAICDRWGLLGAYQGFLGAPRTSQLTSPGKRGQITHFDGGAILWGPSTGAHEVYGIIGSTYADVGFDATCGLPTKEEEAWGPSGRIAHFETGTITWLKGDTRGRVNCTPPPR